MDLLRRQAAEETREALPDPASKATGVNGAPVGDGYPGSNACASLEHEGADPCLKLPRTSEVDPASAPGMAEVAETASCGYQ
jgi:hypothetical protein